jgi:hypothetical protein
MLKTSEPIHNPPCISSISAVITDTVPTWERSAAAAPPRHLRCISNTLKHGFAAALTLLGLSVALLVRGPRFAQP